MSYQIIARKYRPMTFEQVVGQKAVVQTLQNAVKSNRVAQAYIFSGMRGVGKTTLARILAKALNCKEGPTPTPCDRCESCTGINDDRSVDVLEIDGASNRGIDDIRTLRDAVKYKPLHSLYKIIYIDEVHQITKEGFNALLKTLEEPPPQTVFIFATTELHKVPATIVSRCQHFEFKKLSQKEIVDHLLHIAKAEGLTVTPSALNLIAQAAEGSMRDAQSLLDQAVAFSGPEVRDDDLKEILGAIDRDLLFGASSLVFAQDAAAVFPLVEKIMERGYDLRAFHKDLILHFRNLLLAGSVGDLGDLLPLNPDEVAAVKQEAAKATPEELLRILHVLQEAESGLRYSSQPQIYLETLLVRLSHIGKIVPLTDLVREVERLKGSGPGAPGSGGGESVSAPREAPKPAHPKPAPSRASAADPPSPRPEPAAPAAAPGSPQKEKLAETALKDPGVRAFMEVFRGQIYTVEPISGTKENNES